MAGAGAGKRARNARGAVDRPLFLLTDFGHRDPYVGVVKAVLRSLAPRLRIDDLGHALPPQDLPAAAFALFQALPWLPAGSLTLVVVDPGVGGARQLALHRWPAAGGGATAARLFISPDNGVVARAFAWLAALGPRPAPTLQALTWSDRQAAALLPAAFARRPAWGRTFDGRDRFAPLAARLATRPWAQALPASDRARLAAVELTTADLMPVAKGARLHGRIVHCDHFGNALTNFSLHRWPVARPLWRGARPGWRVRWRGHTLPLVASYGAAGGGRRSGPVALVGSSGLLELAVNGGSFATWAGRRLGCAAGRVVTLEPLA